MRTIRYEKLETLAPIVSNPFTVCNPESAILKMGVLTLIDTGLKFDEDVELRFVKGLIDPVAILGICRRGKSLWLAASIYDRVDGMNLQANTPLATVEARASAVEKGGPEIIRFLDFTGGKRGPVCGSPETANETAEKIVQNNQEFHRGDGSGSV
jgi:hypothetical protein